MAAASARSNCSPAHRGGRQRSLRRVVEAREAARDDFAHPRGEVLERRRPALRFAQQLLEEERVAAAARAVPARRLAVARGAAARQQCGDGVVVQARQLDVHEPSLAAQLGERLGGGGLQLVGARAQHCEHPRAGRRSRQVTQQRQRVRVGPVQVVEDEQQRPVGGDVGEQRPHEVEGEVPVARAVGRGDRPSACRQQPRQRSVVLGQPAVGGGGGQRLQQPLQRLDPRLEGHEGMLVVASQQHARRPARARAARARLPASSCRCPARP